jgi:hypothetical protein
LSAFALILPGPRLPALIAAASSADRRRHRARRAASQYSKHKAGPLEDVDEAARLRYRQNKEDRYAARLEAEMREMRERKKEREKRIRSLVYGKKDDTYHEFVVKGVAKQAVRKKVARECEGSGARVERRGVRREGTASSRETDGGAREEGNRGRRKENLRSRVDGSEEL